MGSSVNVSVWESISVLYTRNQEKNDSERVLYRGESDVGKEAASEVM